jgi:hypothetical protein
MSTMILKDAMSTLIAEIEANASAFERWEELAAEERRRNPKLTKDQSFAKAYTRIAALRSERCCAACTCTSAH